MELPDLSLEYILRDPLVTSPLPPVLVLLHGYGCNERDLYPLGQDLPRELLIFFVRAPRTLHEGQYSWFDIDHSSGKPVGNMEQAEEARIAIVKFLREVAEHFPVDRSRMFLGGFSQGGILSLSVMLTTQGLVKGIIPMSGRVIPGVATRALEGEADTNASVFLAHGTEDQIIPVRFAQEARELLKKLNIATEYHEYPIAHSISDVEVADVATWLAREIAHETV